MLCLNGLTVESCLIYPWHVRESEASFISLFLPLTTTVVHVHLNQNLFRSLGPTIINGCWSHHWVYWAGPIGGGVAAALIYQMLFKVRF